MNYLMLNGNSVSKIPSVLSRKGPRGRADSIVFTESEASALGAWSRVTSRGMMRTYCSLLTEIEGMGHCLQEFTIKTRMFKSIFCNTVNSTKRNLGHPTQVFALVYLLIVLRNCRAGSIVIAILRFVSRSRPVLVDILGLGLWSTTEYFSDILYIPFFSLPFFSHFLSFLFAFP